MERNTDAIVLPRGIVIYHRDLVLEFSRGGGPGGQNVNKVSSKVTLRLDLNGLTSLNDEQRELLRARLGSKLTRDGELVIQASEHREQARNRAAAIDRLAGILRDALVEPRKRRATRPTRSSVERRIRDAKRRGEIKRQRKKPDRDE